MYLTVETVTINREDMKPYLSPLFYIKYFGDDRYVTCKSVKKEDR